jgi:hypothetical protein
MKRKNDCSSLRAYGKLRKTRRSNTKRDIGRNWI